MTVSNKNPRHYDNGAGVSTNSLYQNRHRNYSAEQLAAMRETLPELLRALGIENPENRRAFCCLHPDHDDHKPSMSYWVEKDKVHCHSCGISGDALDVAGWQVGITDRNDLPGKVQALERILGRSFGVPVGNNTSSYRRQKPKPKPKPKPYPVPEMLPSDSIDLWANDSVWKAYEALFEPEGKPAREYLFNRGIDDLEIGQTLIGWCKHPSKIIPACNDFHSSSLGWVCYPFSWDADYKSVFYCMFRNLSDRNAKDLKPPKCEGRYPSLLYNEYLLTQQGRTVFVTESILDAISYKSLFGHIAIGLNGKPGVKRLLGIIYHSTKRPRKFVLALDNDDAGRVMSKELKQGLSAMGIPCQVTNPYEQITDAKIKDANDLLRYVKKRGEYAKDAKRAADALIS